MKPARLTVTALAILATAGAAGAADLSLAEAIEISLEQSPLAAAADAEVETATHAARAAGAAAWPTLAISGTYGSFAGDVLYGRFIPGAPGNGSMPVEPYDTNITAGFELKQVLYAGGAVSAARKAGEVEQRVAQEASRSSRREIAYRVTRAYLEVLLAGRRAEVAADSIERARGGVELITTRLAEQEALQVELLGAEGQLAADELALLEAQNDLELARRSLNRLLGRAPEAAVELGDDLESPLQVPPEAIGLERAASGSPEVRMAGLGVERAEAALGQAKSLSRPKMELAAVYTWIDNELFFDGEYAGASVNISIPFFQDAKAGSAAKSQARARKAYAEAMLDETSSAVELQARAAYRELGERIAAVGAARKNLAYHRERNRVTRAAFREEMVTFSEVLDSHDDLRQAELGLSGALFQARLQEAEIRRLTGS